MHTEGEAFIRPFCYVANVTARTRDLIARDPALAAILAELGRRVDDDPGHDVAHCLRVAEWTVDLADGLVDPRLAIAAALLHDVVNLPKDSPDRSSASRRSAEVARGLLGNLGFSRREIEDVADAITTHSFSTGLIPTTPLGEALQDADRLEALGALGVLRAASCGARLGAKYVHASDPWASARPLDDAAYTVDHFFTKLLGLWRTLRTRRGRAEAKKRTEVMKSFLGDLAREMGLATPTFEAFDDAARDVSDEQLEIYEHSADTYDELVTSEDHEKNLVAAIERKRHLTGARVLEVGVGTGRITSQLLDHGASVVGFERAAPMLAVARRKLERFTSERLELHRADARSLPIDDGGFDLAIAGWVFGHFRHWMPDAWKATIGRAVDEMSRGLNEGGVVVIVETMGTAATEPAPPNAALAEYYAWLESLGFEREVIRTDYRFADVETAGRVLGAFFGDRLRDFVKRERSVVVPEYTAVFTRPRGVVSVRGGTSSPVA